LDRQPLLDTYAQSAEDPHLLQILRSDIDPLFSGCSDHQVMLSARELEIPRLLPAPPDLGQPPRAVHHWQAVVVGGVMSPVTRHHQPEGLPLSFIFKGLPPLASVGPANHEPSHLFSAKRRPLRHLPGSTRPID